MKVVFDSSFFIAVTEPQVDFGRALRAITQEEARERIDFLVRELERQRGQILIPTPVLAEVMVKRSARRQQLLDVIARSSRMALAQFGPAAAVECSDLMARHWPSKADRDKEWSRHRLKFDLQILAIARVAGAGTIFTSDGKLGRLAERERMRTASFDDLPRPPSQQASLDLVPPAVSPDAGTMPDGQPST